MNVNELKGNSHRSKDEQKEEPKRVTSTVPAHVRDPESGGILGQLFNRNINEIKNNIITDYILPAIEDSIIGAVRMFFNTPVNPSSGSRASRGNYISYNEKYNSNNRLSRSTSQHNFNYKELVWPTRGKAEAALTSMWEILDSYGLVRIADLFDIAEQTPVGDSTGNDYGWRDLSGSRVVRTYDGVYCLELPKAVSLK